MANRAQFYEQMAARTAEQITGSYQEWTAFLATAARLYKYPYHEQLMIYAQRPEATACAEYDFWNKRMRRYVRRGSRGIALVDSSGEKPSLRCSTWRTQAAETMHAAPISGSYRTSTWTRYCGLWRPAMRFPARTVWNISWSL